MLTPIPHRLGLVTIASVSVLPLVFTSGWASGINSSSPAAGPAGSAVAAAIVAGTLLVPGILTVAFPATRIRRFPRRRAPGGAAHGRRGRDPQATGMSVSGGR